MKAGTGTGTTDRADRADRTEAARAEVNRLHQERGFACGAARKARERHGRGSVEFSRMWRQVEALTEKIEAAERALESLAAEADDAGLPLLRDPAVEMPDDEQDVVVVLKENDEGRGVTTGAHHAGHGWCETQDGRARGLIIRSGMVAGWCHHHEAAEVLQKAVRP